MINNDKDEILRVLAEFPGGAKISDIEERLSTPVAKRTLQRKLLDLKEAGKIRSEGERKATRYFLVPVSSLLPLSKAAEKIKHAVLQPLIKRKPVGYNVNFLHRYVPNESFYLTEKMRAHLKNVGQQFKQKLAPGTYAKRILHNLLVDLSWNSSRLEGNTYSLIDTERLIEFGMEAENRNNFEAQMILNHRDAIEFMLEEVDDLGFSSYMVLTIHALLSNNLLANPKARGQLRNIPVGIGKTSYTPPAIPQLIEENFRRILETANKIKDPFEQSFFAMVHIPYLQAFEDVNKRVSRLCANIPLIRNNLSPLSFIDVSQNDYVTGLLGIYELNKVELLRDVYIWAYERSAEKYKVIRNTLGEPNQTYMKFKRQLHDIVNLIVSNKIKREAIVPTIIDWANEHIDSRSRAEFIQLAEKELASLNASSSAIYKITKAEFLAWQALSEKIKS